MDRTGSVSHISGIYVLSFNAVIRLPPSLAYEMQEKMGQPLPDPRFHHTGEGWTCNLEDLSVMGTTSDDPG